MRVNNIDKGNPFDWGKTSKDYAKYRDIYPKKDSMKYQVTIKEIPEMKFLDEWLQNLC